VESDDNMPLLPDVKKFPAYVQNFGITVKERLKLLLVVLSVEVQNLVHQPFKSESSAYLQRISVEELNFT
jgi:hypothetical protein